MVRERVMRDKIFETPSDEKEIRTAKIKSQ